jgi:hypothetical protein
MWPAVCYALFGNDATPQQGRLCIDASDGSLDAALALVEEKLPGWQWSIGGPYPSGLYRAGFFGSVEADWQAIHAPVYARTAPLAVLIALLRALDA